jgi:hypothetical protein
MKSHPLEACSKLIGPINLDTVGWLCCSSRYKTCFSNLIAENFIARGSCSLKPAITCIYPLNARRKSIRTEHRLAVVRIRTATQNEVRSVFLFEEHSVVIFCMHDRCLVRLHYFLASRGSRSHVIRFLTPSGLS